MLAEFEMEHASGSDYQSKALSQAGLNSFPDMMRDAIRQGNEMSLAAAINRGDYWDPDESYTRDGITRARRRNVPSPQLGWPSPSLARGTSQASQSGYSTKALANAKSIEASNRNGSPGSARNTNCRSSAFVRFMPTIAFDIGPSRVTTRRSRFRLARAAITSFAAWGRRSSAGGRRALAGVRAAAISPSPASPGGASCHRLKRFSVVGPRMGPKLRRPVGSSFVSY
jgi:hypothetical protein